MKDDRPRVSSGVIKWSVAALIFWALAAIFWATHARANSMGTENPIMLSGSGVPPCGGTPHTSTWVITSGTVATVPTDWCPYSNTHNLVEAWGAGGGGQYITFGTAPGGGGGAYAFNNNFATTAGSNIPIQIGIGGAGGTTSNSGSPGTDTIFNTASPFVQAKAGLGYPTAAGGLASASTPSTGAKSGGNGTAPTGFGGGGGGGAGGPHGPGGNGGGSTTNAGGGGGAADGGGNGSAGGTYGGNGGTAWNGTSGGAGAIVAGVGANGSQGSGGGGGLSGTLNYSGGTGGAGTVNLGGGGAGGISGGSTTTPFPTGLPGGNYGGGGGGSGYYGAYNYGVGSSGANGAIKVTYQTTYITPCVRAPPQASAVGYCTNTLSTQNYNSSNVDTGATYASTFQWYLANWFGFPSSYSTVALASGVAEVGATNTQGYGLVSAAYKSGAPGNFVGTAFGGGGYFEWTVSFDSTHINNTDGWPADWLNPIEEFNNNLPGIHWTGQATNYNAFEEIDAMECDINSGASTCPAIQTLHNWYGINGVTNCPPVGGYCQYNRGSQTYTMTTPNTFHKIGLLWVLATTTTNGYIANYYDGVLKNSQETYCQFVPSADAPPPSGSTCWADGVSDLMHFVALTSAGTNAGAQQYISAFNAWQATPNENMVSPTTYQGVGDLYAAQDFYSCTRAYSNAFAAGGNFGCNLRRVSDSATMDILLNTNGNFDSAQANRFAGVDATCAGLTAGPSTTVAFSACTSTPHAGDTITGTGILQPSYIVSCGTFTAGAGTCTLNLAQFLGGQTFSMQTALFVTKAYSQGSGGHTASQATTTAQPEWLPDCGSKLPCMLYSGGQYLTSSAFTSLAQPYSIAAVADRTSNFTTNQVLAALYNGSGCNTGYNSSANQIYGSCTATVTEAANDNIFHAIGAYYSGASSKLAVDGTTATGNPGTSASATTIEIGGYSGASAPLYGFVSEVALFGNSVPSSSQASLCTNQRAYYATPGSC